MVISVTFDIVKNALLTVTQRVYRYTAISSPTFPYIVWAEDSQSDSLHGDGIMINQTIEGTIDLFSKTADSPMVGQIQKALNDAGICFRLNSIQYEQDTKIIHHEWVWNIDTEVS